MLGEHIALPQAHGRRNRGVWGDNVPPTFGTSGVQGGGVQRDGPMKMIFASTADSLYSLLYKLQVTEFQLP